MCCDGNAPQRFRYRGILWALILLRRSERSTEADE